MTSLTNEKILHNFDPSHIPSFDPQDFQSCVDNAMNMMLRFAFYLKEDGYNISCYLSAHRWCIEQAIINRNTDEPMMAGAMRYVEKVERHEKEFNGIEQD